MAESQTGDRDQSGRAGDAGTDTEDQSHPLVPTTSTHTTGTDATSMDTINADSTGAHDRN